MAEQISLIQLPKRKNTKKLFLPIWLKKLSYQKIRSISPPMDLKA
jgi:hypothetical protein